MKSILRIAQKIARIPVVARGKIFTQTSHPTNNPSPPLRRIHTPPSTQAQTATPFSLSQSFASQNQNQGLSLTNIARNLIRGYGTSPSLASTRNSLNPVSRPSFVSFISGSLSSGRAVPRIERVGVTAAGLGIAAFLFNGPRTVRTEPRVVPIQSTVETIKTISLTPPTTTKTTSYSTSTSTSTTHIPKILVPAQIPSTFDEESERSEQQLIVSDSINSSEPKLELTQLSNSTIALTTQYKLPFEKYQHDTSLPSSYETEEDKNNLSVFEEMFSLLKEEKEKNRKLEEEKKCIVCCDQDKKVVYSCGHFLVCESCDKKLFSDECFLCSQKINRIVLFT